MDEVAVRDAIFTLLDNNKATLVSGLSIQGNPRVIATIAKQRVTPPTGYYYISVHVTQAVIYNDDIQDINHNVTEYSCELEVVDYLFHGASETGLFDKLSSDFNKLCDRAVKLIYNNKKLDSKYELSMSRDIRLNRRIERQSLFSVGEQPDDFFLYCLIRFTLVSEFESTVIP